MKPSPVSRVAAAVAAATAAVAAVVVAVMGAAAIAIDRLEGAGRAGVRSRGAPSFPRPGAIGGKLVDTPEFADARRFDAASSLILGAHPARTRAPVKVPRVAGRFFVRRQPPVVPANYVHFSSSGWAHP